MGSYGKDRKQIQIFNEFDPCCFSGNFYTYYDDVVKLKLSSLGEGKFDVILDSSHKKHSCQAEFYLASNSWDTSLLV